MGVASAAPCAAAAAARTPSMMRADGRRAHLSQITPEATHISVAAMYPLRDTPASQFRMREHFYVVSTHTPPKGPEPLHKGVRYLLICIEKNTASHSAVKSTFRPTFVEPS